jgi:glycosyltransferase involved in cell wall biosynthesis
MSDFTKRPLVTIAIPTFNRASWLKDCIASALSQTYPHFEVLVSNNASTDETEQVLADFNDRRLRVIKQKTNIGPLPNWNACLAGARGEYIVLVCDDDRIAPWLLERCIGVVEKEPRIPIVLSLSNIHSTLEGRTWPAQPSQFLQTGIWAGTDILVEYLRNEFSVEMCSIMLRTDAIRAQGGFPVDLPHAADIAAWAPLLLNGKGGLVNEACATQYFHQTNQTERLGVEQIIREGWTVVDLISSLADHLVSDLTTRRTIQLECGRCYARRTLRALSSFRRQGGGLSEALVMLWRFRRELRHVEIRRFLKLRWQIAFILFARQISWIHRLKQIVTRQSSKSQVTFVKRRL